MRKLPVLRGWLDDKRFDLNPKQPAHIDWGCVPLDGAVALTLRLQIGPNMLYWLANSADPEVWKVLDTWATAGTMVLAADFADAPPLIAGRDFNPRHPGFSAHRSTTGNAEKTKNFVADGSRVIVGDEMKLIATTDIAFYPVLKHVQACMVRTKQTQGVALMVCDEAPGPNRPVADAVPTLAQSMLKPGQTRH